MVGPCGASALLGCAGGGGAGGGGAGGGAGGKIGGRGGAGGLVDDCLNGAGARGAGAGRLIVANVCDGAADTGRPGLAFSAARITAWRAVAFGVAGAVALAARACWMRGTVCARGVDGGDDGNGAGSALIAGAGACTVTGDGGCSTLASSFCSEAICASMAAVAASAADSPLCRRFFAISIMAFLSPAVISDLAFFKQVVSDIQGLQS